MVFGVIFAALLVQQRDGATILGKDYAFTVLPPVFASAPGIQRFEWSPNGRRVLYQRLSQDWAAIATIVGSKQAPSQPPSESVELTVWDAQSRTAIPLWHSTPDSELGSFGWIGSEAVLASIHGRDPATGADLPGRVLRLGLDGSAVSVFEGNATVASAPSGSFSLLMDLRRNDKPFRLVTAQNVREVAAPKGAMLKRMQWQSGDRLVMDFYIGDESKVFAFDSVQGKFADAKWGEASNEQEEGQGAGVLRIAGGMLTSTTPAGSSPGIWLSADDPAQPPKLVSGGSGVGKLARDGAWIAYMAEQTLFVRPIAKWSRKEADAARDEALRAAAISNAKQVGLALSMYAQAHGDMFPNKNQNLSELLRPYLKNMDLLRNFTYTFAGGSIGADQEWAKTVLGYVPGPGGVAVVSADTTTTWKENGRGESL